MRSDARQLYRPAALLALLALAAGPARADEDFLDRFTLNGYLDARAVATENYPSWFNNQLGKSQWGASGDDEKLRSQLTFAEGVLVGTARLGWSTSAVVQLQYNDHQNDAVDVTEAYLRYKPVSTGTFAFEARAGWFIPPGSLENTGLGWSSPWTLSSSAINTWIGEELKLTGAEGTVIARGDLGEARLAASIFRGGDPAGSLLAWRGWAIHDFELGVFGSQPLPYIKSLPPNGPFDDQSSKDKPMVEMDHRFGYTVSGQLVGREEQKLSVTYYDNRTDPEDEDYHTGQYGWHTRFWNFGVLWPLPAETTLIGQVVTGNTVWGPDLANGAGVVDVDFQSAFLLASHAFGKQRFTVRYDWFQTDDRDLLVALDNNNEHGRAWTGAWIWRPWDRHRFTVELTHIMSKRPERVDLGVPERNDETVFQVGYRYFFALLPSD